MGLGPLVAAAGLVLMLRLRRPRRLPHRSAACVAAVLRGARMHRRPAHRRRAVRRRRVQRGDRLGCQQRDRSHRRTAWRSQGSARSSPASSERRSISTSPGCASPPRLARRWRKPAGRRLSTLIPRAPGRTWRSPCSPPPFTPSTSGSESPRRSLRSAGCSASPGSATPDVSCDARTAQAARSPGDHWSARTRQALNDERLEPQLAHDHRGGVLQVLERQFDDDLIAVQ